MSKVGYIQVGAGNRGATITGQILKDHADRFVAEALVDVEPSFLAKAKQRQELALVPDYHTLEEALAAHPASEAVFIVTPARFHHQMVSAALKAGRHVWVEKPLTYSYAEAAELAELARTHQRAVVVGNQYQYHPLERMMQELVRSGRFGRAFHVSYIHHRHRPQMRAFTGPFPALWEQGVHSMDSILALLGNPAISSVYALGQRPANSEYNSDTVTNLLTAFSDGTQAHLLVTFDSQRSDWSIRVECERAALLLTADGWDRTRIEVLAGEKVVETIEVGAVPPAEFADPIAAFHAAIETGKTTPTSIEVNLNTIRWIDAAVRSLESGTLVRL